MPVGSWYCFIFLQPAPRVPHDNGFDKVHAFIRLLFTGVLMHVLRVLKLTTLRMNVTWTLNSAAAFKFSDQARIRCGDYIPVHFMEELLHVT